MTTKKLIRCRSALDRLEVQLKSGVKNVSIEGKNTTIPLTEKDTKRIKNEINILKTKLKI